MVLNRDGAAAQRRSVYATVEVRFLLGEREEETSLYTNIIKLKNVFG